VSSIVSSKERQDEIDWISTHNISEGAGHRDKEAVMKEHIENEISMKQYLLGQLTEEEQQRLEERLMTSNEYFEQLLIAEDELIDESLGGRLSVGEQERFNHYFLCTADRHQKLKFSKSLQRYVLANAERAPTVSAWPSFLAFLRAPHPAMRWSLAAALFLLVLGGSWSAYKIRVLQDQLEQAGTQPRVPAGQEQELQRQVAQLRERNDQLSSALQRQQNQQAALEQELASLRTSTGQSPSPSMVAFALTPGQVRDLGEMKKVAIPAGANWVQLQLDLGTDDYKRYQAVLQKAEGEEIWSQSTPKLQIKGENEVVVLTLPAGLLPHGDYILKLSGITASGNLEDVGKYYFRALQK
jgi:hypothetical protein